MNFSRFFQLDKKLVIKVIAGVILLAVAFAFYLTKDKATDDDLTVLVNPESTSEANIQSNDSAVEDEDIIMVDVAGAVTSPSVVELPQGSRVFEAIEKAGGSTSEGDTSALNQAEILTDGQKIYIPTKQEMEAFKNGSGGSGYVDNASSGFTFNSASDQTGLININTADSAALQEIPGVGPATAEKIISYRNDNGKFSSIEDIKNVSGIGDKTFEKMKTKITV